MKPLLFDQNLSPKLISRLADLYPNSTHVEIMEMGAVSDKIVWDFARKNNFVIVSKDADFGELGLLFGFPPKIIWIRRGNCSTRTIELLLRDNYNTISAFMNDENGDILSLL